MEDENLMNLLTFLANVLEKNNFGTDEQRVQLLYNSLRSIQQEIPSIIEIEELNGEVNYLEIKYDEFNDLSYYFNPLYIRIKNKIHEEDVKRIREDNRRKRGIE